MPFGCVKMRTALLREDGTPSISMAPWPLRMPCVDDWLGHLVVVPSAEVIQNLLDQRPEPQMDHSEVVQPNKSANGLQSMAFHSFF